MKEVTKDIFVDENEVVSIEAARWSTGVKTEAAGSLITLKNGKKIYVKDLTPATIKARLYH